MRFIIVDLPEPERAHDGDVFTRAWISRETSRSA